jgi:hypothetical protein
MIGLPLANQEANPRRDTGSGQPDYPI